jgi:hypothetical protein
MKRNHLLLAASMAVAIAGGVYYSLRPGDEPAADPIGLHKGAYALNTDKEEVFSRAFWKRPAAGDNILHAERREWTESAADGPARWQWFLDVEASPELLAWLKDKNPFSLRPADKVTTEAPPVWWPKDLSGWEIRSGGEDKRFTILFSRNSRRLCATDSGAGFTPAAAVPAAAVPAP